MLYQSYFAIRGLFLFARRNFQFFFFLKSRWLLHSHAISRCPLSHRCQQLSLHTLAAHPLHPYPSVSTQSYSLPTRVSFSHRAAASLSLPCTRKPPLHFSSTLSLFTPSLPHHLSVHLLMPTFHLHAAITTLCLRFPPFALPYIVLPFPQASPTQLISSYTPQVTLPSPYDLSKPSSIEPLPLKLHLLRLS